MIWEYRDTDQDVALRAARWDGRTATYRTQVEKWRALDQVETHVLSCKYCDTPLQVIGRKEGPVIAERWRLKITVSVCPSCGWWVVSSLGDLRGVPEGFFHLAKAQGSLRTLNLSDITVPLEDLRSYLVARYDERFVLNPKRFEEIVGGVFADFGYQVRVTSFSGDHGVDVIVLDGANNDTVGVQVKRYSGKIEAEQIRSFAGALVLNSLTKGVFITTSSFTRGARATAGRFVKRGIRLDLWDAERFYDRLRLSQRPLYDGVEDESTPFFTFLQNPEKMTRIIDENW